MSFGIGYGADEHAKQSGAMLVFKSEVGGSEVSFAAFLTDFTQNFSSEWSSERVFGRNDPIANFQGTKRTITLSWDIPSATLKDAKSNLKKCGDLIQFLYPGYMTLGKNMPKKPGKNKGKKAQKKYEDDVKSISKYNKRMPTVMSRAPLVRIKYANLITGNKMSMSSSKKKKKEDNKKNAAQTNAQDKQKNSSDPASAVGGSTADANKTKQTTSTLASTGLLGWIDSLSWKPVLDMGSFSDSGNFYPKIITLSVNFNVLHEEFLGWKGRNWMGGKFPFKIK